MSTELVLVRHGITAWNRERRFQGQLDTPLDEQGFEQARKTGLRLRSWPLAAVYSSDLLRARQTAEAIAAPHGLQLRIERRLRERHYGGYEGRTYEEIERIDPDGYGRWRARDPAFALPGGGETLLSLHARVEAALRDLASRHEDETVAIVTHGGVLDCAFRLATGLAIEAPRAHELLNASLNRIAWRNGSFTLIAWADAVHLVEVLDDAAQARGHP
ncbi:MAG: histidine phosphatase family protein [Burkholderiaceae bacterium]|nr:histidine phosphatase family protein [Burkholderiaceae bacterium]